MIYRVMTIIQNGSKCRPAGKIWLSTADINVAFRELERMVKIAANCGCIIEVIESEK